MVYPTINIKTLHFINMVWKGNKLEVPQKRQIPSSDLYYNTGYHVVQFIIIFLSKHLSFKSHWKSIENSQCIHKMFKLWPSRVTLTLSLYSGRMSSAHHLVEVNIWAKLWEKNPSMGIRFIERTRWRWAFLQPNWDFFGYLMKGHLTLILLLQNELSIVLFCSVYS
jgi:hypothetical protein